MDFTFESAPAQPDPDAHFLDFKIQGADENQCDDPGIACVLRHHFRGHMTGATVFMESPTRYDGDWIRWTNDLNLLRNSPSSRQPGSRKFVYFYAPGVMIHEIGHVLGLDDLYGEEEYSGRYGEYIMGGQFGKSDAILDPDIRYLEQVYRDHAGRVH